jgi:hypothetical protein
MPHEVTWGLLGAVFLLLTGVMLFVMLRVAKRWYWRGLALLPGLLFLYLAATFLLAAIPGEHVMETTSECYRNGVQVPCPPNAPPSPEMLAPNGS